MERRHLGRRRLMQIASASLSLGAVGSVGAASSPNEITFSGQLQAYDGRIVSGRKVYFSNGSRSEYIRTDDSGEFQASVEEDSRVRLGFYKSNNRQLLAPVQNGVPHIDGLQNYTIGGSSRDVGTIQLERGHLVTLRALNEEGEPVPDAEFHFRADGYGSGQHWNRCDLEGYLRIANADFRGVELAGVAEVTIGIPNGNGGTTSYVEQLTVEAPTTVVAQQGEGITVTTGDPPPTPEEPTTTETTERTSTPTETATTERTTEPRSTTEPGTTQETETATQRNTDTPTSRSTADDSRTRVQGTNSTNSSSQRGFLSNGDSTGELEFLSNPFFLTVSGFVLSVGGVVHNLLRGG